MFCDTNQQSHMSCDTVDRIKKYQKFKGFHQSCDQSKVRSVLKVAYILTQPMYIMLLRMQNAFVAFAFPISSHTTVGKCMLMNRIVLFIYTTTHYYRVRARQRVCVLTKKTRFERPHSEFSLHVTDQLLFISVRRVYKRSMYEMRILSKQQCFFSLQRVQLYNSNLLFYTRTRTHLRTNNRTFIE